MKVELTASKLTEARMFDGDALLIMTLSDGNALGDETRIYGTAEDLRSLVDRMSAALPKDSIGNGGKYAAAFTHERQLP